MTLSIFLSFKESMRIMKETGQDQRFIEYYLAPYSQAFEKIYIFSWAKESYQFPFKNVELVSNSSDVNVYLYNLLLPFFHKRIIEKSDIIRLMQFTAIVPALIARMFFRLKIVATYGFPYGHFLKTRGKYIQSIIWTLLEKITLKKADKYIVTYKNTFDYLLKNKVDNKKINLLPNGVDIGVFKPIKNKNKKTNLLFVGRFEPEKNILNLGKALSILKNKFDYFITFIGGGALKRGLVNELDRSGINYKIIPSLPHNQLVKYYQKSDLFLLPSLAEGYPKVLIEAMACGLPPIVARYPGYEQIITDGENGLVCDFNPENISEKIDFLIKNGRLRKKISQNARKFVQTNNNIKKILDKEIKLIRSVYESC
ncbi:MAG: Glycosyl transferase group 1 [Candidatus Wolfebacteria bacterium GW2011_GWC1_43_10]|uniref:Glycosyl transferase group 1 n=2 Tax=Candidatus Wolfeibacteriota TaxID=1752735 RepID=A0A0G1C942_9BACT|nr:MAG: Glycosyl transferase group 1 [Candidatus Wolfebacteria bacterium GW2011_GWC1_43_10]KKT22344.1 MAG: Glycosyl transferase group 1 [Parcubacteria group bacterium GW2011_GWB1_43_8b]OGM89305.1 MAG: hypothetical protein A2108_00680 [Candidatus Wolfebacteria bacterium GWA1_42_9]